MMKPLSNPAAHRTPDRTKPRAGQEASLRMTADLSRSTMECRRAFCARIQLGSGQKVNRGGTRAASIPVEWLLIEFA
ncbi:hypothetical protein JQ631_22365 [Bradyrhizobium manausense]|uniref:hypothetical protein n=1 Tax=Bradyrhizobium manausense TaxID=989370 RepID=UPI001BAC0ABA|nr:hypothetical protein [Bradyrhizobium manausense]MBR0791834.1 hypothetical protein [Bradyrhizobium manausense]